MLDELHTKRLNLYPFPNCILCNKKKPENLTHLTVCDRYKASWQAAEEMAQKTLLRQLKEAGIEFDLQEILIRNLFGTSLKERQEISSEIIKSLIRKDKIQWLILYSKSKRVAKWLTEDVIFLI